MKKLSLILLFALMLTGCASTSTGESSSTTAQTDITSETEPQSTETTRQPLEVATADYDGHEFKILTYPSDKPSANDFGGSDEFTGDTINDAVLERNLAVEEAFNITINSVPNDSVPNTIRSLIQSGDKTYDVMQPYVNDAIKMGAEGLLLNLYDIPGMDITNPWWDAAIIRDLALCGKIYSMTGDAVMSDEEYNYAIFINKALAETYKLDDCYQLVRDDAWTVDKMSELATVVTHDLDGDGKLNENDVHGILSDYSVATVWFFGCGGQMAKIENGVPELAIMSERNIQVLDKLSRLFQNQNALLNASSIPGTWTMLNTILMEDRGLFRVGSIYNIQGYRSMVTDFGVLPYPKYDEAQDSYYHLIATNVCKGISIPITNDELERTGVILEALSYHSKDTVTRAYYDVNLYTKIARDEESGEMLDIIFATKRYDIAYAFGWGGFQSMLTESVRPGRSFTSLYASAESQAQSQLEDIYEKFSAE